MNTQTILVSPISNQLVDFSDSIDATVTSSDLFTGKRQTWLDSVVVGRRGQRDHVFSSDFRPDFGSKHKVEIRRSDGATSFVDVSIPDRVTFELEDDGTRHLRIMIMGDDIRVIGAKVTYAVRYYRVGLPPKEFCEESPFDFYSFVVQEVEDVSGGATLMIDMDRHEQLLRSRMSSDHDVKFPDTHTGLALMQLKLDVTVGHVSWNPPGGDFDFDVLSVPNTLSNLSNGYGFVGGGYGQEWSLWPSENAVSDTWFFDYLMRPPGQCFDYCSCEWNAE